MTSHEISDRETSPRPEHPVRVFFARADEDDDLRLKLDKHLAVHRRPTSKRAPLIATWSPALVPSNAEREAAIRQQIESAQIVVVLISPELFSSERYDDVARALELRAEGKVWLVPVLAKPFELADADLGALQILPRSGPRGRPGERAVSQAANEDEALMHIAREIAGAAQSIRQNGTSAAPGADKAWGRQSEVLAQLRRRESTYAGTAVEVSGSGFLQRVVRKSNAFQDIAQWVARLGHIQRQVCRITTAHGAGTGFLVGPDLVLTSHHVLRSVIASGNGSEHVSVHFDHFVPAEGQVALAQKTLGLAAAGGIVDWSPAHPGEGRESSNLGDILPTELDYVLLRLDGEPGNDGVGRLADGTPRPRGWLAAKAFPFPPGAPMFIVQHPEDRPMQLALDTDAVIGLSEGGLRVTYRTNTERGSSGSPCFNQDWELVALHHHGTAVQSRGIPILKIVERLRSKQIVLPPPPR